MSELTKVCTFCKAEKTLDKFSPHKRHKHGVYSRCKPCVNEIQKKWHKDNPEKSRETKRRSWHNSPKTRESHAEWLKKWRKENPERVREINRRWIENNRERYEMAYRAGNKLKHEIRMGRIERPDKCEKCGNSGVQIEGAHYDYSKPLEVKWLCRPCHRKWDAKQPKTLLKEGVNGVQPCTETESQRK